jgi:3-oxoadipate enol-lactonase
MGGKVAQRLAIDHPDALRGLVLIATTSADPDNSLISARVADQASTHGYARALAQNFPRWFTSDADDALVDWTRTEMLRTPEHVTLGLVADYRGLDFRLELAIIDVPTLVIAARGDLSTPVTSSKVIAGLIPDSELAVIERAGHFVHLERPTEVNATIRQFLSARGL